MNRSEHKVCLESPAKPQISKKSQMDQTQNHRRELNHNNEPTRHCKRTVLSSPPLNEPPLDMIIHKVLGFRLLVAGPFCAADAEAAALRGAQHGRKLGQCKYDPDLDRGTGGCVKKGNPAACYICIETYGDSTNTYCNKEDNSASLPEGVPGTTCHLWEEP